VFALPTYAVTLDFFCITNNSPSDCAIGEAQLSVDVLDISGNQVLFNIMNNGPIDDAIIRQVYFDDGTLLDIAYLIDANDGVGGDAGVDFSVGASPPDLPGGNSISPAFNVTAGFLTDADVPQPNVNGIGAGETLGIVFDLQVGNTYADVIDDLTTGALRIGVHVQAFESRGSESFVNNPVPVPAAVWLFGSGLLGLVGVARRKRI
jgi:hypothetical protein